jgi:hypothetical protein
MNLEEDPRMCNGPDLLFYILASNVSKAIVLLTKPNYPAGVIRMLS